MFNDTLTHSSCFIEYETFVRLMRIMKPIAKMKKSDEKSSGDSGGSKGGKGGGIDVEYVNYWLIVTSC